MAKQDWEVVGKNDHALEEMACAALTGGISLLLGGCSKPTYTIRDEAGNEKKVTARDAKELGERISSGEFD
jgi:hypothetical protein